MEYEFLKQNYLFSIRKRNDTLDDTVTALLQNVKSLPRHVTKM